MRQFFILCVGLLSAAYYLVSPYITVHQIKLAAISRDGGELSEYIEFPSLRQSLKDQLNAMVIKNMATDEMKDNPFAALGAVFAGVMVDKAVEAYVTPAGITQLMSGDKPKIAEDSEPSTASKREPLSDASMSYESLNKFVVRVKDDSGAETKMILRRREIVSWKLTEIIVPLENK